MKKYYKILSLMTGLALMFANTSCLKDDEHFTDFAGVGAIAEIPSSAFYGVVENKSFIFSATPVAYTFDVNIASPSVLSQNVDVSLAVDATALKAYNDANGTAFEVLPTTGYAISTPTVTVQAGKRLGTVTLNFNTNKIDASKSYALPISIKTASNGVTVSSNYATKIIVIKIKNIYEGDYQAVGVFTHPINGARKINQAKVLQTINGNTSETNFADLGGSGWRMQLVVNADNTVKLIPAGAANAGTTQFGINKYDPAKKTFTLNYQYSGGGGFRVINETLTLQ